MLDDVAEAVPARRKLWWSLSRPEHSCEGEGEALHEGVVPIHTARRVQSHQVRDAQLIDQAPEQPLRAARDADERPKLSRQGLDVRRGLAQAPQALPQQELMIVQGPQELCRCSGGSR